MIPNLSAESAKRKSARHFRPHLALTVAAAIVMLLTARLSFWQFDRAEQKAALEQSARDAIQASPILLNNFLDAGNSKTLIANRSNQSNEEKAEIGDTTLHPYQRVIATGVYVTDAQIAIDNRVRQRIAGYHIIAPLLLSNGGAIAVNRGFIARRQTIPPPPAGEVTVHGILQKDGTNAYTLSSHTEAGNIWQNLIITKYAAATKLSLFSLVLQETETTTAISATNILQPATVRVNFKSARSIGYAWQWLTFCALAFVFYIILGFRDIASTPNSSASNTPTNRNRKS